MQRDFCRNKIKAAIYMSWVLR